jgi:DNA-binding beta-propeller fold protein YncE
VSRYNGPANLDDAAWALSVSPDGSKVFVTGQSDGAADYATVAYKAATGAQLWVSLYSVGGNTYGTNLAVSPDGTKLFVTGFSNGHYGTVAYDSVSGAQLWVSRYNGPADFRDQPTGLRVSPDGSKVFVTGQSYGLASEDYATIAYRAASGAQLWVSRYDGGAEDAAKALSVSPDGSQLFVTGVRWRSRSGYDYLTVAYDAASGAERWKRRYSGPANGGDRANSVVVSPDGSAVFVTGQSSGLMSGSDYATIAYGTGRGIQLWVSRYSGDGGDTAEDIGVSPDGSKVFVTGTSQAADGNSDYATLAYSSH